MNVLTRVVRGWRNTAAAAATIVTAMTGLGGVASAAVTPDPYHSITDQFLLTSSSTLGGSNCLTSLGRVNLTGTTTGATGSVTSIEPSLCSGILSRASWTLVGLTGTIDIEVWWGTVTFSNVQFLVENILGGRCLYAGTLTGSMFRGSGTMSVSGTPALSTTLSGICTSSVNVQLSVTTSATITW